MVPDRSEIANHTQRLQGELQTHYDARFLTEVPDGVLEPATGRHYPVHLGGIPHELLLDLNAVDLPIYNLGNHPGFFSRTWFLSQSKPGIVILHDLKLHHFYEGIYRERLQDMPAYLASIREYYGQLGHEAGVAYWQQQISIDFMAQHFPMTGWAIRNALGVLVHTPHALEAVKRLSTIPLRMAPLAYIPRALNLPEHPASEPDREGDFTRERRARLIIFGFLNVNRRIVEFLTALAGLPERDRFEVQLVGTVLHFPAVEDAIDALHLRGQVTLSGYVSEEDLERALDHADLAVNLRFPSMGEASASQLRIWDHALPSLVTYTEGYATMPPDTVFFVRPEREEADIHTHLRHFLHRPADFRRAGERGRAWLWEHHLPAVYVARLDELCQQAEALRSRHNRLALADRVGAASAPWMRNTPSADRERCYALTIAELV